MRKRVILPGIIIAGLVIIFLLMISIGFVSFENERITFGSVIINFPGGIFNLTGINIESTQSSEANIPGLLGISGGESTASIFCKNQGYAVITMESSYGNTSFCIFDVYNECEEWSYYRKECNKTTQGISLSVDALKYIYDRFGDNMQIIDIRSNPEFLSGNITGSINIPYNELSSRLNEINNSKTIIIAGSSEEEKINAITALSEQGSNKLGILSDDISLWIEKGYSINAPEQ